MCNTAYKGKKQAKAKKKSQRKGLKPDIPPLKLTEQRMVTKIGRAVTSKPMKQVSLVLRRVGYTRADNPNGLAILLCTGASTNPVPGGAFPVTQICFAPRLTYTLKEALAALSDPNLVWTSFTSSI